MKPLRHYALLLVIFLTGLSFYIPVRYQVKYPREVKPQFDSYIKKTYQNFVEETKPDILLLGDSMVAPAIDDVRFGQSLNQTTSMISLPGTASTLWYLLIKNNLIEASHKPEYLVVFFRDTMMTIPEYRVTGKYFEIIDELASPKDEVLIKQAYTNQMNPLEKLAEGYFPLFGSRKRIRQSIDYYIREYVPYTVLQCDHDCMEKSMDTVFKGDNMDSQFLSEALAVADNYLYSPKNLDFNARVTKSLLPEIIKLCDDNNIQLILIRMPILRFTTPGSEPAGLNEYGKDMATYLANNNILFLDFSQHPEITEDMFSDSLHLNEAGENVFTTLLIDAIRPYIK